MGETNKTPERVANGMSTEDIRHKLTDVADKLLRIEQSVSSLGWDETDHLRCSAEMAVKLCQKIGTSGMDTVLTDHEIMFLTGVVIDNNQQFGSPQLKTFTREGQKDIDNIHRDLRRQINNLYESADIYDRAWLLDGSDSSDIAAYERIEALKLRLLDYEIENNGADTVLSDKQFQSLLDILFRALSNHKFCFRWLKEHGYQNPLTPFP